MLHILNGDATREAFEKAGLPGETLVWRDMLSEGPAPEGLRAGQGWGVRAARLETDYGIPRVTYLREVGQALAGLRAAQDHKEVMLWFNGDLFCQANAWFIVRNLPADARVCGPVLAVGHYGASTGALSFKQHFWHRRTLSVEDRQHTGRVWDAYAAADPAQLQALAGQRPDPAVAAHLARFPWRSNGLGAVDNEILRATRRSRLTFPELFQRIGSEALPVFGMGDVQLKRRVANLMAGPALLEAKERTSGATYKATTLGKRVALGGINALALRPLDEWLGGVHLTADTRRWLWDPDAGRLLPAS